MKDHELQLQQIAGFCEIGCSSVADPGGPPAPPKVEGPRLILRPKLHLSHSKKPLIFKKKLLLHFAWHIISIYN